MSEPGQRGRPRRPETDERLLVAAAELLRERGPAGVTIEGVASRSGVARTTIYRRFENREQLVEAVTGRLVDRPLPPADLPLDGKVRWVLNQVAGLVDEDLGRGAVAALIAETDPAFASSLRQALAKRLDDLRAQIQTDIEDGAVAPRVDAEALVSLLMGVHLGQVLRTGTPSRGWDDGVVALLARALRPA